MRRVTTSLVLVLALAPAVIAHGFDQDPDHEHMTLGSSEPGGGDLVLTDWDFENRKVRAFFTFCGGGSCLYSTINPAFLEAEEGGHGHASHGDDDPGHGDGDVVAHPLAAGTQVSLEVVARDAALTLRVNGVNLDVGQEQPLGTSPHIHNHPSWQLTLPANEHGDYTVSYRLKTDSPIYGESRVYTSIVTAVEPAPTATASATPTATATPTPTPEFGDACPGDCNGDGEVTVDEVIRGVNMALTGEGLAECPAMDSDGDGFVQVDDIIRAITAALVGCVVEPDPTPTPTPEPTPTATPIDATLAQIQATIFTPKCATAACHAGPFGAGNLILTEGEAHAQLVGVDPDIFAAQAAGLLRVDPGDPDNSFLVLKLTNPPLPMGSRMPLLLPPLSAEEIELIRAWILAGAEP